MRVGSVLKKKSWIRLKFFQKAIWCPPPVSWSCYVHVYVSGKLCGLTLTYYGRFKKKKSFLLWQLSGDFTAVTKFSSYTFYCHLKRSQTHRSLCSKLLNKHIKYNMYRWKDSGLFRLCLYFRHLPYSLYLNAAADNNIINSCFKNRFINVCLLHVWLQMRWVVFLRLALMTS